MNGFPESGFPVLANDGDMVCLNTLYWNPLKQDGFLLDVNGKVRFGAVTAVGVAAGGAISGATTIAANNTVTLSSATAPLTLSGASAVLSITGQDATLIMTGMNASIGTNLSRVKKAFFNYLDVTEVPTVRGEPMVLLMDLARYVPCVGVQSDVDLGAKNLVTTGTLGAGATTVTDLTTSGTVQLGNASTDVCTNTGRMVFRTAGSDPQDATPASRPAGTVAEIVYYSGKMYFCTDAATPTWEKITSG
jgi:hypothetical protein